MKRIITSFCKRPKRSLRIQKIIQKKHFSTTKISFNSETNIAFYELGVDAVEQGDTKSAMDYFKRILSDNSISTSLKADTIREIIILSCRLEQLDEAEEYLYQFKTLVNLMNDEQRKYTFDALSAYLLLKKGHVDEALTIIEQLPTNFSDPIEIMNWATMYHTFGIELCTLKQYDESLCYLFIAEELLCSLDVSEDLETRILRNLSDVCHQIGYVYYFLNEMDKALHYFTRAKKYRENTNEKDKLAFLSMNIADTQLRLGKEVEAFNTAEEGRIICTKILKTNPSRDILNVFSRLLIVQAQYFALKKQIDKAISLIKKAYSLAEKNKLIVSQISLLVTWADVLLHIPDYQQALSHLTKAQSLLQKDDIFSKMLIEKQFAITYLNLQEYEKLVNSSEELKNIVLDVYPPGDSELLFVYKNLVIGYSKIGNHNKCKEYFVELCKFIDPDITTVECMAQSFMKDNLNDAVNFLKLALKQQWDNESREILLNLLETCLKKLNRTDEEFEK